MAKKTTALISSAGLLVMAGCNGGALPGDTVGATSNQLLVKGDFHCQGVAPEGGNSCGAYDHKCGGFAVDSFTTDEWVYTDSEEDCNKIKAAINDPAMKKYVLKVATNARKYAHQYQQKRGKN